MDHTASILIVDNDKLHQQLLSSIFTEYQVEVVESGEIAVEQVNKAVPELVIIENNLIGMDGYECCIKIKENPNTKNTAVFFLTENIDLQGRIKAYGAGADDYLSKPFELVEFKSRVDKVLSIKKEKEELAQQLQVSYDIALDMQKNAAKIQVISRFLEANLCCHDISALSGLFFNTTKELDVSCVIQITLKHETLVLSDTGLVHKMEAEILKMSKKLDRIHSFGKDRSVFTWENVSVLVRNIGDNIDIMAILMNGLEAGIRSIETEASLLALVHDLGNQNNLIQSNISQLFNDMKVGLTDTFLSLGLVSSLDVDDEDRLNDLVDQYQDKIRQQLSQLNINNDRIEILINELRTSSVENNEESNDDIDGVSLF